MSKTGITEEERRNSTYNPIYMGAKTDQYGHEAQIITGKEGAIGNKILFEWDKQFAPAVYKSADNVYTAVGYGLSNSTMIIGNDGIIIVDTNDSIETAQMAIFHQIH